MGYIVLGACGLVFAVIVVSYILIQWRARPW